MTSHMLIDVTRNKTKTELITVRVSPRTYAEFQAACENRGISMSSDLHQHMVQIIREERQRSPDLFAETLTRVYQDRAKSESPLKVPEITGSPVSEIDHPEEIRSLEDLKRKKPLPNPGRRRQPDRGRVIRPIRLLTRLQLAACLLSRARITVFVTFEEIPMFSLNGRYQQGTPSIECPNGKWFEVERDSLQAVGILAGDIVCLEPAGEWPREGPVLIREDGLQKIAYCVMDEGGNLDIELGGGSRLHWVTAIHGSHLLGWVIGLQRHYKRPPAFRSLELVESTQRPTIIHKGEKSANGKKPNRLNLQR
jgi:hypothetical protein